MRVLLVGDLHGNTTWLERAVFPAAVDANADLIMQLGDFGWWPGSISGNAFIDAARRSPMPLWWIDGNHEHHDDLAGVVTAAGAPPEGGTAAPVQLDGNLAYLPRATRIDLDGVRLIVCGGAHSIDRQLRNPGRSWFELERITEADIALCCAGGPTDILVCHDAPAGWQIPGLIPDEHLAPRLQAELPSCRSHRELLARIAQAVAPSLIVHGHYHSAYAATIDASWGALRVVGLGCDTMPGNLALLECNAGTWGISPLEPAA